MPQRSAIPDFLLREHNLRRADVDRDDNDADEEDRHDGVADGLDDYDRSSHELVSATVEEAGPRRAAVPPTSEFVAGFGFSDGTTHSRDRAAYRDPNDQGLNNDNADEEDEEEGLVVRGNAVMTSGGRMIDPDEAASILVEAGVLDEAEIVALMQQGYSPTILLAEHLLATAEDAGAREEGTRRARTPPDGSRVTRRSGGGGGAAHSEWEELPADPIEGGSPRHAFDDESTTDQGNLVDDEEEEEYDDEFEEEEEIEHNISLQ